MQVRVPALFCGASATGKSAIIGRCLASLDAATHVWTRVLMTPRTSAATTRALIEAKLGRTGKASLAPPRGVRCAVFVDDLSACAAEEFGAQPPLELLRQVLVLIADR